MAREVQHNSRADRVSSHGRPPAPADQGSSGFPACRHDGADVVDAARENNTERRDPVVGRVIGVCGQPVTRGFHGHARGLKLCQDRCTFRGGDL
jgi:hypothetical protein